MPVIVASAQAMQSAKVDTMLQPAPVLPEQTLHVVMAYPTVQKQLQISGSNHGNLQQQTCPPVNITDSFQPSNAASTGTSTTHAISSVVPTLSKVVLSAHPVGQGHPSKVPVTECWGSKPDQVQINFEGELSRTPVETTVAGQDLQPENQAGGRYCEHPVTVPAQFRLPLNSTQIPLSEHPVGNVVTVVQPGVSLVDVTEATSQESRVPSNIEQLGSVIRMQLNSTYTTPNPM